MQKFFSKRNLPNLLTYARIVVIPVLIASFYLKQPLADWICAGLFLAASVTDFFDGYLARHWHVQSNMGRFLDPIADKLLVATALLLLVSAGRADVLPAIAILCREVLVSGLREFLAGLKISVPVSTLAKFKTAAQMVAINLLLWGTAAPKWLHGVTLGNSLLWLAAGLTLVTGYAYLRSGLRHVE